MSKEFGLDENQLRTLRTIFEDTQSKVKNYVISECILEYLVKNMDGDSKFEELLIIHCDPTYFRANAGFRDTWANYRNENTVFHALALKNPSKYNRLTKIYKEVNPNFDSSSLKNKQGYTPDDFIWADKMDNPLFCILAAAFFVTGALASYSWLEQLPHYISRKEGNKILEGKSMSKWEKIKCAFSDKKKLSYAGASLGSFVIAFALLKSFFKASDIKQSSW